MSEQEYDKEQLRIMRNAFKAFDHEDKGFIEHGDLMQILEILGQKLDDKAIKALIKEVDKGNSGQLDFKQFCRLAARFVEVEEEAPVLMSELREAFRIYDKEGKGYITVETLRGILHELDDKLSNQDLDMIIEEIDADGSGTVDFDEFMQVMTGKNFQDIFVHQRFTFDPQLLNVFPSRCPCPQHRQILHRRIEMQFQRLFKQMLHPLNRLHDHCLQHVWHVRQHPHLYRPSSYKDALLSLAPVAYCRPSFRPRFPKWAEPEYDKEQLRIMRNAFKAFDHEDKGFIEHGDVIQILEILGQKLEEKAVKALIKEVDKGSSGKLDFKQFCKLASRFVEVEEDGPVLMGELKEAFRIYDREGKGYITVAVLRSILHELDDKLQPKELDMIIEEIDTDGSGTVDFDEFVQVMNG